MRVYIACSLKERARAQAFRAELEAAGHACTARWLDRTDTTDAGLTDAECRQIAHENHDDMAAADALVALLSDRVRGLLVEVGFAVGAGKRVVIVGAYPGASPMLDLRGVRWTPAESRAIDLLTAPAGGEPLWVGAVPR